MNVQSRENEKNGGQVFFFWERPNTRLRELEGSPLSTGTTSYSCVPIYTCLVITRQICLWHAVPHVPQTGQRDIFVLFFTMV